MGPRSRGAGLRLLIVGVNYAPEETGTGPYTTGLAEHLQAKGHDVSVIAGLPYYPSWRVPSRYRRRLFVDEMINGIPVRRAWHHIPRSQSALQRALFEATFLATVLLSSRRRAPDVILGIVPTLSGAIAAALLSRRYGVPFGVLFQDLIAPAATQSGIRGGARVAGMIGRVEGWAARRASAVGIVAEDFAGYLQGLGVAEDRIFVVRNWARIGAPSGDRQATRQALGWDEGETIVLHAGNMGLKQGLEQVVQAAQLSARRRLPIRFALLGDGNQRAMLEAAGDGVENVQFLDPVPSAQLPNVLAAADVLLVSELPTVASMSLPSKLTSYFAVGRPVLAAVSPEGATAREIGRSGAGLVVAAGDPERILSGVERLTADKILAKRLAAAGPAYAASSLHPAPSLAQAERFIDAVVNGGSASARALAA